jgi:menaquinone-dependent protoporphyrinogen oxidase
MNGTTLLVAFATKHGSTQEVAESVAEALRARDVAVDVVAASAVTSLEHYDGVVLGGALYMGRWHGDALKFLKSHRHELASTPLAVFAMGPKTLAETEVEASRAQLDRALASVKDIVPVSVAIFGGVVDPTKLHFPLTHMPASDARDWDAITAWADELGDLLVGTHAPIRA